jgi:predicted GNAT family acetyltransferase
MGENSQPEDTVSLPECARRDSKHQSDRLEWTAPAELEPVLLMMAFRERLLDNAVWWSLLSHHRHLAESHGRAARYRTDVSPFAAVETFNEDSWNDLGALIGPSSTCVLFSADIPTAVPTGWSLKARGTGCQMLVDPEELQAVEPIEARRLTADDVPQMLELVRITQPGPFLPATIAMGMYFGHFRDGQLVAMAGERLRPDGYAEISAVCTHPDVQRQGLASALTHRVAAGIIEEGSQPFLHVAESNERARRVYEVLGFRQRRLVEFVVFNTPPV